MGDNVWRQTSKTWLLYLTQLLTHSKTRLKHTHIRMKVFLASLLCTVISDTHRHPTQINTKKRFVRSHRISYSFTFPGLTETWLLTCMRREPGAPERRTCWRRNKGRRGSRTSPPPGKESGQLSWPCLDQNLRGDRSYSPGEERKDLPEYT